MKALGLYGILLFNLHKIEDENAPIRFQATVPDLVKKTESRTYDRILIEMEMDGYVTQLRINSSGDVRVSLGKYQELELDSPEKEEVEG